VRDGGHERFLRSHGATLRDWRRTGPSPCGVGPPATCVGQPVVGRAATPANQQPGLRTSRSMQSWKLRRRRSGR
jgi:hypothetical protein